MCNIDTENTHFNFNKISFNKIFSKMSKKNLLCDGFVNIFSG